ncbi:RM45 protein, partial [Catharus fuscescens]|nr:RM45 protein [Catharus fuscescens]
IIDPYVPPEGDARMTSLSKDGVKQQVQKLRQTAASQLAYVPLRIWGKVEICEGEKAGIPEGKKREFVRGKSGTCEREFVGKSRNFFNKQKLHSLVTERCYPDMVRGNRYKTIRWRFVESLEPPRVVHVRCESIMNRGNLYGQVTVRMHSRQILAIYDRFGRLMYGGEEIPKDVLEYVVFERYLVNPYGTWRMHGKIVPDWAPPKDPIIKTVMIPGPAPDPSEQRE